MGMPWGAKDRIPKVEAAAHGHEAETAPVAAAVMAPVAAPVAAAPEVATTGGAAGEVKPAGLSAPRGGAADDLKTLEGVGPAMEKLLHELGIYHFDQIAGWGPAEVAWMDGNLKGFKGRVSRDKWVAQAKLIGEVGMEEFLRRAKTNDY
jgi:NADH-quinone oxidoreductase subunit E